MQNSRAVTDFLKLVLHLKKCHTFLKARIHIVACTYTRACMECACRCARARFFFLSVNPNISANPSSKTFPVLWWLEARKQVCILRLVSLCIRGSMTRFRGAGIRYHCFLPGDSFYFFYFFSYLSMHVCFIIISP